MKWNVFGLFKTKVKEDILITHNLCRSNPGPVFQINSTGNIEFANPAAKLVFCDDQNIKGQSFQKFVPEIPLKNLRESFNKKEITNIEVNRAGKCYLLQFINVPSSNTINVYGIDITESKRLQTQLLQTTKLASIGEMAAGVGHEINNPLAIIKGNSEIIEEIIKESNNSDIVKDSFNAINISMKRIGNIVESLKNYSREDIEENSELNIEEQLKESTLMVKKILQTQGIELCTKFNAKNKMFIGHPGRFHQVIINMINNSAHALENIANAKIELQTFNKDENLCIVVKDNGKGIPDNIKNKIFESFFTTKPRGQGTGLGMGISQSIIAELGGTIKVESEVNVYTSVTIEIPFIKSKAKEPLNIIPLRTAASKGRVLVVDDEEGVRNTLSKLLFKEGYEVFESNDGEDAIKKIKNNDFIAVFSDIHMPKMNGHRLFQKIRAEVSQDLKLFLMTGGGLDQDSGQNDVLYKPFRRLDLLELLSNHFSNENNSLKKAA